MKTKIYSVDGKQGKEMNLPSFFSERVREDLIQKIIEAKKVWQPYAPSPVAGNQHSASGKLKHHRKVWKSQYGRGMSRVPRKTMSVRGSQFNWVGATVPNTRGGRRAHPPKVMSMISLAKINKKELVKAFNSAISATADEKYIKKKYETLREEKIGNVPYVVESKITQLKTKDLMSLLKIILGEKVYDVSVKKKKIRAGIGKLRGRKHKTSAGMILVLGNEEKLKNSRFEIKKVSELSIVDLAKGGPGRIVVYTENAVKDLENKFNSVKEKEEKPKKKKEIKEKTKKKTVKKVNKKVKEKENKK